MPVHIKARKKAASAKFASGVLPFGLPQPPVGTPQLPAGISLCMIVRNEEKFLEQCLRSVAEYVDEICVVDTGSTDRTVEIAKSFGAKIELREWRADFGWARNESVAMATRRWIIQLDADEELHPDSREALRSLRSAPAHLTGGWIRCLNATDQYLGSGALSHAITRIFPNNPRLRYRGAIHEFVTLDNLDIGIEAVLTPVRIIHHGYLKDIVDERDKAARNLSIIRRMCEEEPEDAFNWFNLGMTHHILKDYDEAIEAFEKMREMTKNMARGYIPNGLCALADAYTEGKNMPEKGAEASLACLKASPHYANAHFSLGKAYFAMRRFDDARKAYMDAIDDAKHLDKQFVVDDDICVWKAHSEIGSTYSEEGDLEKALEWYQAGAKNRPAQPIRLNLSRTLERLGRFTEAGEQFRSLYQEFADEQSTLNYINYLLRRGLNAEALAVMENSLPKMGTVAAVQLLVAAAAVAQKMKWHDGETYLRRALEIHPGSAEALNVLEAVYTARGDTAALAELHRAELEAPCVLPADFTRRTFRLIAAKDYARGLEFVQRGSNVQPVESTLHYNNAICLMNTGRRDEALKALDAVDTSIADVYAQARFLKGVLLREDGRNEEALTALREVIDFRPSQVDAIVLQASILENLERLEEAEAALRSAWSFDRPRAAVELAGMYLRAGRIADAQRTAAEALT